MILLYSSTTGTGELGVLFFLSLIINYYLDLNYVLESRSLLLIRVLLMGARCSFIYFTFFLVVFALAILIFIVIILTLARSNNFVCIFLCLQRASLVGFFDLPFFDLAFFSLILFFSSFLFLSFQFLLLLLFLVLSLFHSFLPFFAVLFFCLVLLFVSSQSILAIFWCTICVTVIINLSVILSTLHLCYSYPCFLYSLGWCRPDVARTVLCLCCRSVV